MHCERIDLFIIFQTVLHFFVLWRNRLSICVITDQFQDLTSYRRRGTLAANGRLLTGLICSSFYWHFYWPHARDVFSAMAISTALLLGKHNNRISSILVQISLHSVALCWIAAAFWPGQMLNLFITYYSFQMTLKFITYVRL